jgi:cytoskeleton protein RodZ
VPSGQTDDALTLGAALRDAREAAGLSVEQVSADTRIRATLVRDLEADQFASSGGAVYARGHVKSIASTLHVDPAPLLALFDQVQGPPADLLMASEPLQGPVTSFGGSAFASAAAALTPERRGPRWGVALAGAATALVGITVVGYVQQDGSPATHAGLNRPPATASPTPGNVASTAPQAPDLSASKPPVRGAQLRLRLIGGYSWVSVSNATVTLFEGTLRDGEFKDFSDVTRLKVVVGNAQPVNVNCGGRDSGPAGGPGAVRRFECTAAGLTVL